MFISSLLVLFISAFPSAQSRKDYTGYKVVDVPISSADDVVFLRMVEEKYPEVTEWMISKQPGDNASFTIAPGEEAAFCEEIKERDLECFFRSRDLQGEIMTEHSRVTNKNRLSRHGFDLFNYNRHSQINAYLDDLVETCKKKGLKCKVITIGQSYEGRDMKVIKITSGGKKKPGIWIDAGIHAREWITPATAVIIANRLIFRYREDPETAAVVDAFDWYILPSANPDGYEYTWDEDRFWRKTRSPNNGSDCIGTDPNRNWDFHWAEAGTSPDPCSDIYPGPYAFSEREVVAIVEFLEKKPFLLYLSLHAYSQLWITPWSYTADIQPDNYDRLFALGNVAAEKIRDMYNRRYEVGQVSALLYAASGSSMDWALHQGIKYSLAAELRDRGEHGFLLPVEQIPPVGRETWLSIREMAKLVKEWEL